MFWLVCFFYNGAIVGYVLHKPRTFVTHGMSLQDNDHKQTLLLNMPLIIINFAHLSMALCLYGMVVLYPFCYS